MENSGHWMNLPKKKKFLQREREFKAKNKGTSIFDGQVEERSLQRKLMKCQPKEGEKLGGFDDI